MRKMRHDVPETNPRLHIDALPSQGRRVVVSNDPRPAAKQKADSPRPTALTTTQPQPKRDPVRDAKDVTAAHRDEALARIRNRYQEGRK